MADLQLPQTAVADFHHSRKAKYTIKNVGEIVTSKSNVMCLSIDIYIDIVYIDINEASPVKG